jgi:hypothetical protein
MFQLVFQDLCTLIFVQYSEIELTIPGARSAPVLFGDRGTILAHTLTFNLLKNIFTDPIFTFYPMGTRGYFPGVERREREADHSPPTSAEVKKMWIYTSTPPYTSME